MTGVCGCRGAWHKVATRSLPLVPPVRMCDTEYLKHVCGVLRLLTACIQGDVDGGLAGLYYNP